MPLVIVSKQGTPIQFDQRILRFAEGLELFDKNEPIVFNSTITTEFLNSLRSFYELNNFEKNLLDVKTEDLEKDPKKNLGAYSPHTWLVFKPYYERFQKDNRFQQILQLLDCAQMLRVSEYKQAVLTLLGTILHLPTSNYDIQAFIERYKLKKDINQIMLDTLVNEKSNHSYNMMNERINAHYKAKVEELFRQPVNQQVQAIQPAFGGGMFGAY